MQDNLVTVNVVGDLFSDSNIDYSSIEKFFKIYSSKNIPLILNLEGSINFDNSYVQKNKAIPLSLDISILDLISKYNIIVSLANNHTLDFGSKSLKRLIGLLEERSIDYFGLREDSDISNLYKLIGCDNYGNEIIIAGCGWSNEQVITKRNNGYSCLEFEYKLLKTLFEHIKFHYKSPRIILYSHYGYEYEYWPLPEHVFLTRSLIDIGYSVILGSHTHTIQAYEKWEGKSIYHGLGNFFFYSKKINHSKDITFGKLVKLNLNRKNIDSESILIKQNILESRLEVVKNCSNSLNICKSLSEYSKSYKYIRLRQKNPRPILYPNKKLQNFINYQTWKFIVMFLGLIKCRSLVKRILSW